MIVALDACYLDDGSARVGAIAFQRWEDEDVFAEWVTAVIEVEDYDPGEFYRRELPCLIAALDEASPYITHMMTAVIVDGYVWLDAAGRHGLGAHLYDELGGRVAVVGVAKNEFAGHAAHEVLRGASERPLFVTAAGMSATEAAERVASMHGPYRVPTLLRRVDELSRSG